MGVHKADTAPGNTWGWLSPHSVQREERESVLEHHPGKAWDVWMKTWEKQLKEAPEACG